MRGDGCASDWVTITRTADTNAYTANDVINTATSNATPLQFTHVGDGGKNHMVITSCKLRIDDTALISGEGSYSLALYNASPASALQDNAAWDLPSGDRTTYIDTIVLGTPVDLGSTLFIAVDNIGKQIQFNGTSLYGYLITSAGYTPTSARVYNVKLHGILF